MRRKLILVICMVSFYSMAWASPETFQQRGEATFRWFGIPVYKARLFTPDRAAFNWQHDFSLELTYMRAISRENLVKSTLSEMQRIGVSQPDSTQLENCFRDVSSGDRFHAQTHGANEIEFRFNNAVVCQLRHPDIKSGFMSIFLGENTKSRRFTRNLRGD